MGPYVVVAARLQQYVVWVADHGVAVLVLLGRVPERGPGTDVVPADVERHDHGPVGVLHHRVVDRLRRAGPERVTIDTQEVPVVGGGRHRFFACGQDVWPVLSELVDVAGRPEQEHPGVPEVVTGLEVALGSVRVRFLDEPRHREPRAVCVRGLACSDVAVAGLGRPWHDPERDQSAGLGERDRGLNFLSEPVLVLDQVVRGQDQQQRVLVVPGSCTQRGQRDRGGGVPAHGLEDDLAGGIDPTHLLGGDEPVVLVADQDRLLIS